MHVYLEAAGCASYEQFYSLLDQVYETGRQEMVLQMMKDFFQQPLQYIVSHRDS